MISDNSALEDFATEIESDVTALWMVIMAEHPPSSIEAQQRRAYEVVAVMKQRFQHLEESIALTVTPPDHKVSSH